MQTTTDLSVADITIPETAEDFTQLRDLYKQF